MLVTALDHLVITVRDLAVTVRFYTEALGMAEVTFDNDRKALAFGQQKTNLHVAGHEFEQPSCLAQRLIHHVGSGRLRIERTRAILSSRVAVH